MAKAATRARARPRPGARKPAGRAGGSAVAVKLLAFLCAGAFLSVLPLTLILLPGMMPTLVVFFVDRSAGRYLTCTVGALNLAGVVPFLFNVLKAGLTFYASARLLADPFTWIVMYGAAAGGWAVYLGTPTLARVCVEIRAAQQRRTLEASARAMREEWGDEVATGEMTEPE